jgi:hypothetical protein
MGSPERDRTQVSMHAKVLNSPLCSAGQSGGTDAVNRIVAMGRRVALAARNAVSSRPSAPGAPRRSRSSTRRWPCSRTAAIAVCQPIPNATATAATLSPSSRRRCNDGCGPSDRHRNRRRMGGARVRAPRPRSRIRCSGTRRPRSMRWPRDRSAQCRRTSRIRRR